MLLYLLPSRSQKALAYPLTVIIPPDIANTYTKGWRFLSPAFWLQLYMDSKGSVGVLSINGFGQDLLLPHGQIVAHRTRLLVLLVAQSFQF